MDKHDYSKSLINNITPKVKYPNFEAVKPLALTLAQANYASEFYSRLKQYIIEFEQSLSDHEEVALRLVSFGESIIIHVDDISFSDPSLITFTGTLNSGEKVQLIQHVTQLSFVLMAAKTAKPIQERERIGYKLQHERTETHTEET